MHASLQTPQRNPTSWVYVSLTVVDGPRRLKPSHVSFDHVRFNEPPRLISAEIEIILINGDEEQRQRAIVLPHDPDALRIPIQLLPLPY